MLRFKSLQFGYKGHSILKEPTPIAGINFEASQLITLIGRNGSGKSTLLRVLAGLQKPIEGVLTLHNISYHQYSVQDFAKALSIVTTERIDAPFLSIRELVALGRHPHLSFGGRLSEKDHQIVETALQTMGIEQLADKMIGKCSDGQRQSAMIARALAQQTDVMLLDEITAHLDFVHRHQSFGLLKKLAEQENKLIIMATHEIELALKYSHQILLLDDGQLSIYSPAALKENRIFERIFDGFEHRTK